MTQGTCRDYDVVATGPLADSIDNKLAVPTLIVLTRPLPSTE